MRPVTPRATAAPPGGAGESAQTGMARMLPAGMVSKRFQQLFKGKGGSLKPPDLSTSACSPNSDHNSMGENGVWERVANK